MRIRITFVMPFLLSSAACGDAGGKSRVTDVVSIPDAASDSISNGDMSDVRPPMVPAIREALSCSPRPGTGVDAGTDLMKVTLGAPDAICNDGSPAVMYVRAAATAEAANDWVFHLQGGGTCVGADCADRWCDRNEKMTSTATPPGMTGKGIMRRSPRNALGDANQVFLYYCSSDNWAGTARDAEVVADPPGNGFRLDFLGAAIVDSALSALEAGVSSDDGTVILPALGGAGRAIWTGTSAGCQGVANTADRFAVRAEALGLTPWVVCDANTGPVAADLPPGDALDAVLVRRQERFALSSAHANPSRDESCVAEQAENPWLCEWSGHVLANHVTEAPLFLRMSLADGTISDGYLAAGFTIAEFATGVRSALLRAATGEGLEAPAQPIAVYGPGCTQHVGLTNDAWFFDATIDVDGTPLSLHDAIVEWLDGGTVTAVDTAPPTLSTCVATTDDAD